MHAYVTDHRIERLADTLLEEIAGISSIEGAWDKLYLAIYLNPLAMRTWKFASVLTSEFALPADTSLSLATDEVRELLSLGLEIARSLHRTHYRMEGRTRELLLDYIVYKPSYRLWHHIISKSQQMIKHDRVLNIVPAYFVVRDLICGYDANNPYSLNIANIMSGHFIEGTYLYQDNAFLSSTPTHQYLLQNFVRLLQVVPNNNETRELIEKMAGATGMAIAVCSVSELIYTDDTAEWARLGWQYGQSPALAGYALASILFKEKAYEHSRALFEFIYASDVDEDKRWRAALRLAIYYTEVECDMVESLKWTERANEIKPDGQAFDLLAGLEFHIRKDYEKAYGYMLRALNYGTNESRELATGATFAAAIRSLKGADVLEDIKRTAEKMSEKIPSYSEFIQNQVRDHLLSELEEAHNRNQHLQTEITRVENLILQYKGGILSKGSDEVDRLETQIVEGGRSLLSGNEELRRIATQEIAAKYPDAFPSTKEMLIEGHMLYALLDREDLNFDDYTAPMVYFSKALEHQVRSQLEKVPGFNNNFHGLGDMERFIRDNLASIIKQFGIRRKAKIFTLLKGLKRFRTTFRNEFVHQRMMPREVLEDLMKFAYDKDLFVMFEKM